MERKRNYCFECVWEIDKVVLEWFWFVQVDQLDWTVQVVYHWFFTSGAAQNKAFVKDFVSFYLHLKFLSTRSTWSVVGARYIIW